MSEQVMDRARPVRAGEELDAAAIGAFLRAHGVAFAGDVAIEQFPSGFSNLTYLLRAGDRELVLRRPPAGAKAIKAGHDMGREYRILTALKPVYPKVPQTIAYADEATSPIGVPFYVMERVKGVILRAKAPKGLELGPERMRALSESFVDTLVELHAVDPKPLADLGKPEGYLTRQVNGWHERYEKAKTDDIAEMDEVAKWLGAHVPAEAPPTLIHNDFKYDNLVLDPDTFAVRALLDWEMATIADPLSDLGMALGYWIQETDPDEVRALGIGLTAVPGNLTRAGLVERYGEKSGRDVGKIGFHYVLGLFKIAVIAQQIYSRYAKGLTQDERFGALIFAVNVLAQTAARAIERGGDGVGAIQ